MHTPNWNSELRNSGTVTPEQLLRNSYSGTRNSEQLLQEQLTTPELPELHGTLKFKIIPGKKFGFQFRGWAERYDSCRRTNVLL